jgi:hypothetical protein
MGVKRKKTYSKIWDDSDWVVIPGQLVPGRGRPSKTRPLFQFIGEKLPYASLATVKKHVEEGSKDNPYGVYLAHDSFGVARYGGRGDIFGRLATHKRVYPKELQYFSFFIIKSKNHEREIETAILRAASSQMTLNERKVRTGLAVGRVTDYEPGTRFVERQSHKGRRRRKAGPKRVSQSK